MRQCATWILVSVALLAATVAGAANWPQLQNRLEGWQGAREVILPAGVDPLEDTVLAPVMEALLEQGYAILPDGSTSKAGLTIEVRDTSSGKRLLLKRAADGAIVAMEKLTASTAAPAVKEAVVLRTTPHVNGVAVAAPETPSAPQNVSITRVAISTTPTQLSVQHQPQRVASGEVLFELDGAPLQVVSWPAIGGVDFYLLYDRYVQRVHSDGNSLQLGEKFIVPVKPTRALHLDIGDLDSDGQPELAAVWAEDVRGVADGTNTLLHSWVLAAGSAGITPVSQDLGGYIAIKGGEGWLQKRLAYAPFAPEVFALSLDNGHVVVSAQAVSHQDRLLFNQVQWPDSSRALVWNDEQRLMLVAQGGDSRIPGSTLLTDFGLFQGATVSIPLREPEYRSGFSANDRIMAKDYTLNRRMLRQGDGVFTLVRARTEGLPLVGRPSGADRLIQIVNDGDQLAARYPFAPIEAFIVDFSITDETGNQAAVLLNEKADGTGRTYLRLQKAL